MVERFIDVPGGRLEVHDFGEGPPIVLLHANIVDAWAWEPLTPILLAAGYRVVAFDRRGFGGSTTQDVEFSNRADTVAVLDALGFERAVLVGNSAGGQIALDTAVEAPERVAAVVAIGSSVPNYFPGSDAARRQPSRPSWKRSMRPAIADAIAEADVRAWVDGPASRPTECRPTSVSWCARWTGPSMTPRVSTGSRPLRGRRCPSGLTT